MDRNIFTKSDLKPLTIETFSTESDSPPVDTEEKNEKAIDSYSQRLTKYIPIEVITLYMLLYGVAVSDSSQYRDHYLWAALVVGLLGTFFWLKYNQKVNRVSQIILSCLAYCAWAITLSETPFDIQQTLKSFLAPVLTFIIAAIKPSF